MLELETKMKSSIVLLSVVLAASVATTAEAAHHARHHAHHRAAAARASTTDWAANPYMDSTLAERNAFFRDSFNPLGAK
jgi:hypothetical protein